MQGYSWFVQCCCDCLLKQGVVLVVGWFCNASVFVCLSKV